ncbi:MAG: hypothetical protein AAF533_27970 [Acidobacteriota bacterium]
MRIVIVIEAEGVTPSVLMELKRLTGRALGELREALTTGRPVFERDVLDNRLEEHVALIEGLLTLVEEQELGHDLYELREGTPFETRAAHGQDHVSLELLRNLLEQLREDHPCCGDERE